MKLTKRERFIVQHLYNGARLYPPGQFGHLWALMIPTVGNATSIYAATIQRMKKAGILEPIIESSRSWLFPTKAALEALHGTVN